MTVFAFMLFKTGVTIYETIAIRKQVNKFMSLGVLNEEISTDTIKYYEVSRETYYSDEYERAPFFNNDYTKPGAEGDILVTQDSPFPYMPGIHQFITFFFGGHSGYIAYSNKVFETLGYPEYGESLIKVIFKGGRSTHANFSDNYWLYPDFHTPEDPSYKFYGSYYRKEWIGLRVKEVTEDEVYYVTDYINDLIDAKAQYNFSFLFFKKNRYYCTDLMSRPYETILDEGGNQKYNLNMDGFAVTVNDLIMSKDTYIAYYVRTDKNNVKHIYFIN